MSAKPRKRRPEVRNIADFTPASYGTNLPGLILRPSVCGKATFATLTNQAEAGAIAYGLAFGHAKRVRVVRAAMGGDRDVVEVIAKPLAQVAALVKGSIPAATMEVRKRVMAAARAAVLAELADLSNLAADAVGGTDPHLGEPLVMPPVGEPGSATAWTLSASWVVRWERLHQADGVRLSGRGGARWPAGDRTAELAAALCILPEAKAWPPEPWEE
ncbi:hypothetical protein [Falsiroseomonas sp.]|uniref:hypothetical protein n=1 Tax=Falsiroseomonas sp. TaxID=2870721 RepID=UPI003F716C73